MSSAEWPGVRLALLLKEMEGTEMELSHTNQDWNPGNEEVEEKPENAI